MYTPEVSAEADHDQAFQEETPQTSYRSCARKRSAAAITEHIVAAKHAAEKLAQDHAAEVAQAGLITGIIAVAICLFQHKFRRRAPRSPPGSKTGATSAAESVDMRANKAPTLQLVQKAATLREKGYTASALLQLF